MLIKHLQDYLEKFTQGPGGKKGNAVSNARVHIMDEKGFLEEIKRIEVHESTIIVDSSIKVVLKPQREKKLILNPGLVDDH